MDIINRLQNKDKSERENKKEQSTSSNKSNPLSQRFPAPKEKSTPSETFKQRHGQQHAHSQSLTSQIPSHFSQPHFRRGDIVLYQGQQAEVMRVMDNMVQISYPASQYIMNRRKKTVDPMELKKSQVFG